MSLQRAAEKVKALQEDLMASPENTQCKEAAVKLKEIGASFGSGDADSPLIKAKAALFHMIARGATFSQVKTQREKIKKLETSCP